MSVSRSWMVRLLDLLRLPLLLSAVSNIWLMVTLASLQTPATPGSQGLSQRLLTPLIAAGLMFYGTFLNDVLDERHDRTFRPHRPLPSGHISVRSATLVSGMGLLLALAAAAGLGQLTVAAAVLTAGAILFYNTLGKFVPAAGLVSLGLIRAAMMMIAVPDISYTWPACLVLSHVVFAATITYSLEGKRPRLHPRDVVLVMTGWAFWALLLVGLMAWRDRMSLPEHRGVFALPALAAAAFLLLTWAYLTPRLADLRQRRDLTAGYVRWANLWLIVYDVAWLSGAGVWRWAAIHVLLLALAALAHWMTQLPAPAGDDPGYRVTG